MSGPGEKTVARQVDFTVCVRHTVHVIVIFCTQTMSPPRSLPTSTAPRWHRAPLLAALGCAACMQIPAKVDTLGYPRAEVVQGRRDSVPQWVQFPAALPRLDLFSLLGVSPRWLGASLRCELAPDADSLATSFLSLSFLGAMAMW